MPAGAFRFQPEGLYCGRISVFQSVETQTQARILMRIFRISFFNHGKVYQLYAETVRQGELYGFVEVEGLIFGENSTLVVDPSEEKLKDEFSGVSRIQVPMHAVIRVDEVEKRGHSKILEIDGNANVTPFPSGFFGPGKGK